MNGRILSLLSFFLLLIGLTGDERICGKRVMVSVESLKRHVEMIHFDRNPYEGYPKLEQAAQYIKEEFVKAGLDVKEESLRCSACLRSLDHKGFPVPDGLLRDDP